MKALPKISIVIPSYNKVKYIQETLESIVSQKYPNLEVIIQDGGSTDGTLEIINKYAKKYPKIISRVSKKDKGQADAINKGLKKVTGDIITYINADDVYEDDAFKKVSEYFANNPKTLWLAGKGKVIDKDGKEIARLVTLYKNLLLKRKSYFMLLVVNYLMQPSVFLSRKAYKKYEDFESSGGNVMEYKKWLEIGKDEMPAVLDDCLSSFRITRSTISSTLFRTILVKDYKIAAEFTENPFILLLHQIHNFGRVAVLYLLKK